MDSGMDNLGLGTVQAEESCLWVQLQECLGGSGRCCGELTPASPAQAGADNGNDAGASALVDWLLPGPEVQPVPIAAGRLRRAVDTYDYWSIGWPPSSRRSATRSPGRWWDRTVVMIRLPRERVPDACPPSQAPLPGAEPEQISKHSYPGFGST